MNSDLPQTDYVSRNQGIYDKELLTHDAVYRENNQELTFVKPSVS